MSAYVPLVGTPTVVTRTQAEADKAGNVYTARAMCTCGYRGNWTKQWKAEELVVEHRCDR